MSAVFLAPQFRDEAETNLLLERSDPFRSSLDRDSFRIARTRRDRIIAGNEEAARRYRDFPVHGH